MHICIQFELLYHKSIEKDHETAGGDFGGYKAGAGLGFNMIKIRRYLRAGFFYLHNSVLTVKKRIVN